MTNVIGLKAKIIAPFNYGHLLVNGGVATIPDYINDRAILFSIANALGMLAGSLVLPEKPMYRQHIGLLPWRASLFHCDQSRLNPPLARRSDLGVEGGYQDNIRRATGSGNFKEYFTIQEVPAFQEFFGLLTGPDPFEMAGSDSLCVRIGSNRTGMALLSKCEAKTARLNAATARLFERVLPVERFILDSMQATQMVTPAEAASEMSQWN